MSFQTFHIDPKWNIKDYKNLDYILANHYDPDVMNECKKSGHPMERINVYKYHDCKLMPESIKYVKEKFNCYDNVSVAINLFKPAQYLPYHIDNYQKYIEIYNVKLESIIRGIVMLEDSCPGQIIHIQDDCFCKWNAGDCFFWNYNVPHTFYNFSTKNRYSIQITGTLK
jgi:hypothetical protein